MTPEQFQVAVRRSFLTTLSSVQRRVFSALLSRATFLRVTQPSPPSYTLGEEYNGDSRQVQATISVAFISLAVVPPIKFWHNKSQIEMSQAGSALAITIHRKLPSRLWDDLRLFRRGYRYVVGYVNSLLPAINRRLLDNRYMSGHVFSRTYAVQELLGISVRQGNDVVRIPWPIAAMPFPRAARLAPARAETYLRDYVDAIHAFLRNDFDDCIRRVVTATENFFAAKRWTASPPRIRPPTVWRRVLAAIKGLLRPRHRGTIPNSFKNVLTANVRTGVDPIWWTVSLRCCSLHGMYQLELDGAGVVDRRVAALDVVEAVDVVADR
jgi:hypothetical protein